MATEFFGERWDAPLLDDGVPVQTPVGEPCLYACGDVIADGDQGVLLWSIFNGPDNAPIGKMLPAHRECHTRAVIGSVDHLEGRCLCLRSGQPGGDEEASEPSTFREQGRATIAWLEARR